MAANMIQVKEKGPKKMRAIEYTPGPPQNMTLSRVLQPPLREQEVLIKVYASGINRADILQRQGHYPPPPGSSEILGLEVCGIIETVSESCTKWSEGNHVIALLSGGGYSEFVAVHEDLVMALPDGLNFQQGAAIPENWVTAYQLLYELGNIQENQSVLIHGGGSGVGLALVQLASVAGAKAIITAGSESKIAKAVELGAVAGINYKQGDFATKVLELTSGVGVNLILDCVGSSHFKQNVECISDDGHWIIYGLMSAGKIESEDCLRAILMKRIKLQGTTLRARSLEYRAKLIKNFTNDILPLFANQKVKPVIDSAFPLGKIADAHKRMEDNENIGKIVLLIRGEAYNYDDE